MNLITNMMRIFLLFIMYSMILVTRGNARYLAFCLPLYGAFEFFLRVIVPNLSSTKIPSALSESLVSDINLKKQAEELLNVAKKSLESSFENSFLKTVRESKNKEELELVFLQKNKQGDTPFDVAFSSIPPAIPYKNYISFFAEDLSRELTKSLPDKFPNSLIDLISEYHFLEVGYETNKKETNEAITIVFSETLKKLREEEREMNKSQEQPKRLQ